MLEDMDQEEISEKIRVNHNTKYFHFVYINIVFFMINYSEEVMMPRFIVCSHCL